MLMHFDTLELYEKNVKDKFNVVYNNKNNKN